MSLLNITIVGGGACGISAFIEFFLQLRIAQLHKKISVTIIEENKEVGKGLAFGTKQPGHILNTQADLMGIHFTEPAHFSDWLKEHDERIGHEVVDNQGEFNAFTTRRLYGDYLKEQFEHYFKLAKNEGMQVEVIRARAVSVSEKKQGYEIVLSDNKTHQCDYLVLSPGTPVADNYPKLEGKENYFGSPWPSAPILEIPTDEDVAILGSSLSAIDAVMTLTDNDHQGKITLYSLDGLMPRVQAEDPSDYRCKILTVSNLHKIQREKLRNPTVKEMLRLFMQEAELHDGKKIDWDATDRTGKSAKQLLKKDIEVARNGGDALMNVPLALRYESSEMWKMLDETEKLKFKKWVGNQWNTNRHCMPLVNAERVEKLFSTKQLRVNSDLTDVQFDTKSGHFNLVHDDKTTSEKYLINATGPASAVKDMKSELIQNLSASGMIEAEKAGGIKIHTETMQVMRKGKTCHNLYALGHITNGLLLDVNAVWFNVKTIGNLSRHLINNLTLESTI
ncbi:FAD/NAD(P)-binding protein [Dyadobacter psychrotolerans]|uniref:FAD-dependent urate hydroxylase HpyO/Asp monooxygenase CreE-like FAD/NAD(P)-binding domain-containing protein n=1 Tax=Dyadobacter psychrotolerans TaxID=2541721 RepID=A0A4R5DQY3_9BACT|nr:FAD/NAD(P)-binding protein [Dyadobacter psychrotolerans]TDE14684.1 hypothetical protein E0F88_15975 [Dyadobacter psychrotolerans]